MSLSYSESAGLMADMDFHGRIKVALLNFASYVSGEQPNVPAHNSRYKWAQQAMQFPDQTATQLQPVVVMDPGVQSQGAAIADGQLQSAVEGAINKLI